MIANYIKQRHKQKNGTLSSFSRLCTSTRTSKLPRSDKTRRQNPIHGAHGMFFYDPHDKNWIPHIEINNPSNCEADTKNKIYQEIMFLIGKYKLKKYN